MKPRGFHELKHVLHQRAAYCYALCKLTSQFTLAKPTRSVGDRKDRSLRTRAVTETPALMISGCALAGYIRDEMARAYFRYQGRCREINGSLNKSCVRARARARACQWSLCRPRCRIATSVNFVNVFRLQTEFSMRLD